MKSVLVFPVFDQVEEVACSILSTTCEAHVIIPPIDASDLSIMAFNLHIVVHLTSVEVIDIDEVTNTDSCGKQMAAIAELDLSAMFDSDARVLLDTVGKDIHHLDLVLDCHQDVESTWMEGDCHSFFSILTHLGQLESLLGIIPDHDHSI